MLTFIFLENLPTSLQIFSIKLAEFFPLLSLVSTETTLTL